MSDDAPRLSLRDRLWRRWFPPVAVIGGVATLIAAAWRTRPAVPPSTSPAAAPSPRAGGAARGRQLPMAASTPAPRLERAYTVAAVIGRAPASLPFRESLDSIAIGPSDQLYALGDHEVRVFDGGGHLLRQWRVADGAQSVGVAPDGRVFVGGAGRVDVFAADGRMAGGFAVGNAAAPASLTALRPIGSELLVADASARIIRRYDAGGRQLGVIGDRLKTKSFLLPNGHLDLAVDGAGRVLATDTGRHQVTVWALDGELVSRFGKFGMSDPADFVGCCNPINLAVTPDGKVVTAEKMIARVKVFEPDGRLIGFIGPEHFDPMCTHIYLAVDAAGRIFAADPVRREIQVFAVVAAGREGL